MFCIVGLKTFFLLDNSSDRDVLKGHLFVNGKHLHEVFQGKSALKQGAATGENAPSAQRATPGRGFKAPCLLCLFSFHFLHVHSSLLQSFLTHLQQKGRKTEL